MAYKSFTVSVGYDEWGVQITAGEGMETLGQINLESIEDYKEFLELLPDFETVKYIRAIKGLQKPIDK